jgi:7,8-dihydropterin-6-yl-methyl-4-(beta-D-ribofuranosyl)aminobenzene 5'-phosphate synthase
MAIKLTTLSENTAGKPYLLAEWGLSILIETDEKTVLLDTGAGESVVHNAAILGVNLTKIDTIVLSHGHFDHTGGLQSVLPAIGHPVTIIAHQDIWIKKYDCEKDKPPREIGIPYSQNELEELGARFVLTSEPYKLSSRMTTSGEVPMINDFEYIDPILCVETAEGFKTDPLKDDLAVIIDAPQGLIVVLGCGHRGMINTLNQAKIVTGKSKIHMVLGGCHLKDASEERIWQTISGLNEMGTAKLATCHCSGMPATLLLAQTYDKNFIFNQAGKVIEIP